jgi:hypothetical protein
MRPFGITFVCIALGNAVALVPSRASASCSGRTVLEVWPEPGALAVPRNTRIVLRANGPGVDTQAIRGLGLTLWSIHGSVRLRVIMDQYVDDPRPTRTVVLEPEGLLDARVRYRLSEVSAAALGLETDDVRFETGDSVDRVAPTLAGVRARPFVDVGYDLVHWIPVDLDAPADDGSGPLFVWIRLARSPTALRSRSWIGQVYGLAAGSENSLGHGMCAGNWSLEPGDRLIGLVSVVDSAGNESSAFEVLFDATSRAGSEEQASQ